MKLRALLFAALIPCGLAHADDGYQRGMHAIRGTGIWYPAFWFGHPTASAGLGTTAIGADEEKIDFTAQIENDDNGAHVCSAAGGCKIGWKTGSVWTLANAGTHVSFGIQNADPDNGPPARGDGTFDVWAVFDGGTDTLSANSWYETDMEQDDGDGITVGHLDEMTIRWHITDYGGADTIRIAAGQGPGPIQTNTMAKFSSSAWAAISTGIPLAVITYDDGHKGWFVEGFSAFGVANESTNNIANDAEECLAITPVANMVIDAAVFKGLQVAGADGKINIYSDPWSSSPKLERSQSFDNNITRDSTNQGWYPYGITDTTLIGGIDYTVCVQSTTANNIAVWRYAYGTAGGSDHSDIPPGGRDVRRATRSGGSGAFTEDTTGRPWIAVRIKAIAQEQ